MLERRWAEKKREKVKGKEGKKGEEVKRGGEGKPMQEKTIFFSHKWNHARQYYHTQLTPIGSIKFLFF